MSLSTIACNLNSIPLLLPRPGITGRSNSLIFASNISCIWAFILVLIADTESFLSFLSAQGFNTITFEPTFSPCPASILIPRQLTTVLILSSLLRICLVLSITSSVLLPLAPSGSWMLEIIMPWSSSGKKEDFMFISEKILKEISPANIKTVIPVLRIRRSMSVTYLLLE